MAKKQSVDWRSLIRRLERSLKQRLNNSPKNTWLVKFQHSVIRDISDSVLNIVQGKTLNGEEALRIEWLFMRIERLASVTSHIRSAEGSKDLVALLKEKIELHRDNEALKALYFEAKEIEERNAEKKKLQRALEEHNLSKKYMDTCRSLYVARPSPNDLEKATGISASTWKRRFKDPLFLGALKKEAPKRQGHRYSKSRQSKEFWEKVEAGIDELIDKAKFSKDAMSKTRNARGKLIRYKDTVKTPDAYAGLSLVMSEEIERDYSRKTTTRNRDTDEE